MNRSESIRNTLTTLITIKNNFRNKPLSRVLKMNSSLILGAWESRGIIRKVKSGRNNNVALTKKGKKYAKIAEDILKSDNGNFLEIFK